MPKTIVKAYQVIEDTLQDKDNDTKIQVEETADEDKIRFDTAGSERMIIDNAGNVGIGTSSPGFKWELVGNASISGTTRLNSVTYTWPGSDGSSGQVLSTNGSGTLSWSAASGGSGNTFQTIAVSGQSSVVADASNDTLTLAAGSNVTITTDADSDTLTITSTNTNTTYTAGDGLDLSSTTFSLDLKSSGGLKITSGEVEVEPANFAGAGLADDGSDNLRLDINGLAADSNAGNLSDSIAISDASDSNATKKITVTQLKALIDTNSVRTVGVDTNGDGSTDNTLGSGESLILKAGTNVTLAESAGVVTLNAAAATSPAGANTQIQYNNGGSFGASSNLTWDGTNFTVSGNANFSEYIYHAGDTDTFIQFADDAIGITAGGEQLITISEAAQDIVKIGDGGDVDFQVRTLGDDNTLYVQGDTDRVGIGTNAPSSILHIKEAAPTLTFQRENNSNASTINFIGASANTANSIIHDSSTNDLVFKTFNGSAVEEILRVGDHYGSNTRQVVILSGSRMPLGTMQPKATSDIAFFVSGSIGSRGTSDRGTAVFGGDLVVSGSMLDGSGNAIIRAIGVDTDGNGSTDSTLESSESLILKAGTNVTLAESAGVVTINSSGGGSVRAVGVDTDGNGSTDNTLESGETLVLKAGSNISLAESTGVVTIAATDTNTTYSAGDGLDLSGTTFSLDLKASSGLKIDSTELAIEPTDFAGSGLEDDGSDNLRMHVYGLPVDSNAGALDDFMAISDTSDSNLTKRITLTQFKSIMDSGTQNFDSVTIGGSSAGTISFDASPTLAATLGATGTTITLNDGLGSDFSEVILEFLNSDGALTTKANSVPINVTSISGTPLKSRLIFNIHPDHFHASNLNNNKWHTHWATAGSEPIRIQFRDYEGTTLTIIPVRGDVDSGNSFAVPGRPNVVPAGSGGCRRDIPLYYSVGIETGMQDNGEELLWNIAVCIYDAITRGEIKFESVNILHDTGFATSDLGAVSNSNYMGSNPGFGILSVDALMIISDTAESSGHPVNMKIHRPAGKTWATLSAGPIKIYNDLHSTFNIDVSSNFSAPTNTSVYYTQRAIYGKEQDGDSSLTNAEAALAMANVINNLPLQITATANGSEVSLSTNQGNATVQTNSSSNFGVTSFDGAGSVAIQDGLLNMSTGTGSSAKINLYCEENEHKVVLTAPANAQLSGDVSFVFPASNGSNNQVLKTDGSGNTSWVTRLANIAEDTSPQLGGDLDLNGKSIEHKFSIVNDGNSAYTFSDAGSVWFPSGTNNPTLYLRRGEKYVFAVNASGHPFYIKTSNSTGTGSQYTTGVTGNGATAGNVVFKVPMAAPNTLHYNCENHGAMNGVINIV